MRDLFGDVIAETAREVSPPCGGRGFLRGDGGDLVVSRFEPKIEECGVEEEPAGVALSGVIEKGVDLVWRNDVGGEEKPDIFSGAGGEGSSGCWSGKPAQALGKLPNLVKLATADGTGLRVRNDIPVRGRGNHAEVPG